MENSKVRKYIPLLISVVAFTLLASSLAFANHEGQSDDPPQDRPNFNSEIGEQIKTALENGNYQEWLNIVSEKRPEAAENITEEDFMKMLEAHELREEGNHEEAKEIMQEIRPEGFKGKHFGKRFKNGPCKQNGNGQHDQE